MSKKPVIKLFGQDGNVFAIMGRASSALKQAGLREQSKEMCERCMQSHSYGEALNIINEYVDYAGVDRPSRSGGKRGVGSNEDRGDDRAH